MTPERELLRELVDGEWISSASLMNRAEALLALPATQRSELAAVAPYHEQVREAAQYLENGSGGADYIAWSMSTEIIRLAEEAVKAPLSEKQAVPQTVVECPECGVRFDLATGIVEKQK